MQINYSQTHDERVKESILTQFLDSQPKAKKFYLKVFPSMVKLFDRSYFLSLFLLIMIQTQEISIFLTYRQQLGKQNDGYTGIIIQYINYTLLINILGQTTNQKWSELGIFYLTLFINVILIVIILLLIVIYKIKEYDIPKIKPILLSISFLISIYPYIFFLPALKSSLILVHDLQYTGIYIYIGIFNIILSWINEQEVLNSKQHRYLILPMGFVIKYYNLSINTKIQFRQRKIQWKQKLIGSIVMKKKNLIINKINFVFLFEDSSFQKLEQIKQQMTILLNEYFNKIGFMICIHDYDYSFKERDKMSKRFSYNEVLKFILQGILPLILEYSSESVLAVYSWIYSLIKIIIYYQDQTYFNETISCFYSILTTFYASSTILFLLFLISPEDLNYTLFMFLAIPLSYKLGKVIYNYLQTSTFKACLGNTDLSKLSFKQLDIYIRLLNKNMNFFYEDYIDEGQGIIFENLYVNHQINCDTDDYRCFCHDFRRQDNKLEFEEYIGQDFRKKYVMFYIVNLYEQYLKIHSKKLNINSITFAYISFLFEIMKISTKSFNMIYISQFKLVSQNASIRDLFYQQILLYRVKNQFSHFFSNPSYQNQRLFIMAPILFDENMENMKVLIREQLINTGIFYDYLCSNFIDLNLVDRYARILHLNLSDLKSIIVYLYNLNPDNLELQQYSIYYANLLEFENTKVSEFKKKSKNLSKKMMQPQDRNIQVFAKKSCIVYASLIKKDGLIKKVSNSFSKIYGIENSLIIGKTLNSLIPKGLYNTHDDIISNFKNKGSMNIINKEQRMVFGLNGEGFIIPLTIRLKLENMNDDFGVCSLLTSVNHDKEYLFISDEGQIMDITKKFYNLIFKNISSVNDLRRFNIKHLIPLIWGIQEVSEYDKIFYSILVVSKNLMFSKDTKVQDLKSNKNMQEAVDSISIDDEIYCIQFKISIITTSIGLNFKFVEIDNFKKEENVYKKRIQIQNLKQCLNDILKNDVNFLIKEISEQQAKPDFSIQMSQSVNEEFEGSFLNMRNSQQNNQNRIQSSNILKDQSEESQMNGARTPQQKNLRVLKKQQLLQNGGSLIQATSPQNSFPKSTHDHHQETDEEKKHYAIIDFNQQVNSMGTPKNGRDKSMFTFKASPRVHFNQNNVTDPATSLPPTTDRLRLIENHPLLTELGAPSTNRANGMNGGGQVSSPNFSLMSLQSPLSQNNLVNKQFEGNNQQFFPSFKATHESNLNQQNPGILIESTQKYFDGGDKKIDFNTISSENSDISIKEVGQIVIKRHESRSKSENHIQLPNNYRQNIEIKRLDHQINQDQRELLKEIEQDDNESHYLRVGSQDFNNNGRIVKIETNYKMQGNNNKYDFGEEIIKEVDENEGNNEINQNEMITSYRSLMKTNHNQRQQKTIQINAMLQHQNTARSLNNYNQEMKLSLDKEEFKKDVEGNQQPVIQQNDQIKVSNSSQQFQSDENQSYDEEINTYDNRKQKTTNQEKTVQAQQNNDQSSVHSSKTSEQTKRKTIIKKIKSQFISKGLKAMIYIGIVAFFIFMAVSLIFYVKNYESYDQYIEDFNKVTTASLMFLDIMSVVKVFSYTNVIRGQPYEDEEKEYSEQRYQIYIDEYKECFMNFVKTDKSQNQKYVNYLLTQPFNTSLFHIDGIQSYPSINKNESQIEALQQFFYVIQRIEDDNFDQSNIAFLWYNLAEFKKHMLNMQYLIEEQARDQFTNIEQVQIIMVIIILVITSILIFTALPLSVYNIIKCEEILSLFGCFHPEKLQKIVDIIEETIYKLDQMQVQQKIRQNTHIQNVFELSQEKDLGNKIKQSFKDSKNSKNKIEKNKQDIYDKQVKGTKMNQSSKQQLKISDKDKHHHLPTNETYQQVSSQGAANNKLSHNDQQQPYYTSSHPSKQFNNASTQLQKNKIIIKRISQKRTRQIASFNRISRIDLRLVLFAFLIIVIMMIPPILNIVFSNQYMNEGKLTLKERIIVLDTIVHLIQYQASHYNLWLESQMNDFSKINKDDYFYYQILQDLTDMNQSVLTNLQSILEKDTTRYDEKNYDEFYVKILRDNICQAYQNEPTYFNSSTPVTDCPGLSKGIMSRGFIMATKSFLEEFQNYYNIYTDNFAKTNDVLQDLLKSQRIRDINKSVVFLLDTFHSLDDFSAWTQSRYNSYINSVAFYMFICYVIIVILIFFTGWSHIFFKFYKDFDSTKKLLSLFNMNVITENAFLMQFLKNNDFGIK